MHDSGRNGWSELERGTRVGGWLHTLVELAASCRGSLDESAALVLVLHEWRSVSRGQAPSRSTSDDAQFGLATLPFHESVLS